MIRHINLSKKTMRHSCFCMNMVSLQIIDFLVAKYIIVE